MVALVERKQSLHRLEILRSASDTFDRLGFPRLVMFEFVLSLMFCP
jgi:hypothetical protein